MLAAALAFGLLSEVAEFFSESYGASFVCPPAGVSLAASAAMLSSVSAVPARLPIS